MLAALGGRADALRAAARERRSRGGYEELFVCTPVELAALLLNDATPGADVLDSIVAAGERFAMLLERIDELLAPARTTSAAARRRCSPASSARSTA